ncbi:MAG: YciI family protein [Candidatus Polarisedimenticolia bacterium]
MSETTRDELYPRPEDLEGPPDSEAPPQWLEDRVVDAVRREGLLHAAPAKRRGGVLAWGGAVLAAGLMAFAAGLAVGRIPGEEDQRPRFVLLLYEDDAYQAPGPGEMEQRVAEYAGWARGVARQGHLVSGEKLKDEDVMVGPVSPDVTGGPGHLAGYFVMAARDSGQAEELARGCPHLKHGGRISIRQIDPT